MSEVSDLMLRVYIVNQRKTLNVTQKRAALYNCPYFHDKRLGWSLKGCFVNRLFHDSSWRAQLIWENRSHPLMQHQLADHSDFRRSGRPHCDHSSRRMGDQKTETDTRKHSTTDPLSRGLHATLTLRRTWGRSWVLRQYYIDVLRELCSLE